MSENKSLTEGTVSKGALVNELIPVSDEKESGEGGMVEKAVSGAGLGDEEAVVRKLNQVI